MKSHARSHAHDGRGRHRRASSPETRRWREIEADLDRIFKSNDPAKKPMRAKPTPPPQQPSWMDAVEYAALLALRADL